MKKNIFIILLFILIAAVVIFVGFLLYSQVRMIMDGKSIFGLDRSTQVAPAKNISNYSPEKIIINDSDLNGLDGAFENIRQASLDNNISLLNKYYSEETLRYFASSAGGRIIKTFLKDVIFSNIRKISSGKLLVTVSQVEMSGHTENQDIIFVREKNGWKMGVAETKVYFGN